MHPQNRWERISMPKNTFYRISEEKRNRIMNAAKHEFLSVPYSDVSINRIIKEAEIPRGSFYQYFDGKEDLFHFVLQEHKNNLFKILAEGLEKSGGDIFKSAEENIDRLVESAYHDESGKSRMLFSEPWFFETVWKAVVNNEIYEEDSRCCFLDKIDRTHLEVEDEEELVVLVNILGMVIRDSMGKIFLYQDRLEEEQAKKMMHARVETLKKHYSK